MTAKTRAELLGDADARLPDNSGGLIKPEHVRDQVKDTADSALFPEDLVDADSKATPVNADALPLIDSVDGAFKLLSWSGLKATLKGYFDNVYAAAASLATVATSGSYNDLGDKPTIPAETPDATTGAKGKVQLATAAEVRSAAPGDKAFVASLIKDASALVALTDAATVAIDWSAFVVGDLVVTANRTIGNPTNVQPGVSRSFFVFGSDATERSIIWGSAYKGNMPTETVTSTRGLLVTLTPKAAGTIAVTYVVLE